MDLIADILLAVAGGYVAVGLAVGAWFILRHLPAGNPVFAAMGFSLRLLLLPAAVGLWPLMLAIGTTDRSDRQHATPPMQETNRQRKLHQLAWWLVAPASVLLILAGAALSRGSPSLTTPSTTAERHRNHECQLFRGVLDAPQAAV